MINKAIFVLCVGAGVIYLLNRFRISFSKCESKPCPMCEGKDTVYGEICYLCDGDGVIPREIPRA